MVWFIQIAVLPSEDMAFHDMDIFDGHLVLSLNKNGFPMLCSIDLPIKLGSKVSELLLCHSEFTYLLEIHRFTTCVFYHLRISITDHHA